METYFHYIGGGKKKLTQRKYYFVNKIHKSHFCCLFFGTTYIATGVSFHCTMYNFLRRVFLDFYKKSPV